MTLNFFTIVTQFSVFLTLLLTLFFFVTRNGNRNENKILGLLLFIFNIQIFYSYATSSYTFQYFLDWHKSLLALRQTSLLIGPLIYLYVVSFLKNENVFRYRNLLHFVPFLLMLSYLFIYYNQIDHFIIWEDGISLYNTLLILAHNLIYIGMSALVLKSANSGLRGIFKNPKIYSHNVWLQILLIGFIMVWIVNVNSFALYMILKNPVWCAYTASIFALTVFLFANAIMLLLLLKPDIYYKITKYKNNPVKEEDKNQYLQKLNYYMESHKPFLNPEISLESLALEISVSPRILSQIINETFHKNFKGYILEFRIKESMQILADPKNSKLTILEVLYQVGFNTKSAFNNQFKLYTNLTPQEYRSKYSA